MSQSSAVIDISLTEDAWSLLQVYAFPHMKIQPKLTTQPRLVFGELVQKGLVREGRGYAVVVASHETLSLNGEESSEQFEASLKPHLVETPGWVITEKAINMFLQAVEPQNREKAERVMRTFIADKDPNA